MKRIVPLLMSLALGTAMGSGSCCGADVPAPPKQPAAAYVGDYGRQSALVIEGNQTFTREQILSGMKLHLDYHVTAHPAAPLADYTAGLEHKITLGYQRAGFPAVTVKAAVNTNAHHVVVHVNEGPSYRCGDILLSGVSTMTNDAVRHKIAQVMAEFEDVSAFWTNMMRGNLRGYVEEVAWLPGEPAPFDVVFSELLTNRVQQALTTLGFCQPRFTARIVPDSARKLADLKIEFADEGFKGTIAEIEVNGLYTNTRPQLLDYLKLKPGMEVQATRVAATSNQLWLSARFFRHDVALVPLSSPGQFKLVLDLDEVREAPPLNQEFSPTETAVLKFRDWLDGWETRTEDFVVSVDFSNSLLHGQADLVLSPAGMALGVRESRTNGPAILQYALIASEDLIGLYSLWRQSRFTMPRNNERGQIQLKIRPPSPKTYGKGDISFLVGMNAPQRQPFRLEIDLQPAVFLSMAHWMDSSLKDGVLTLSSHSPAEGDWQEIHIDATSGRLIAATNSSTSDGIRVLCHPGKDALVRLNKEIAMATANSPNSYVTNHGPSSWASFFAADLLKPPLLEILFDCTDDEKLLERASSDAAAIRRRTKTTLTLAREIFGQRNLDALFEPLDRILGPEPDKNEEYFVVPTSESLSDAPASPLAPVCSLVLNTTDTLMPRDAWPWVLIRESAFTVAGRNPYTQTELDKLLRSDAVGPVGCLATAYLLDRMNPKLARTFAERGLARLNLDQFGRDYRLLLRTNFIVSDLAGNALGLLDGVNQMKLTSLLAGLSPDDAAFARQLIRLLAEAKNKGQSPADAIWPAMEQNWEKVLRRYLELGLNQFLPQVQFLTNNQALYDRALTLVSPDSKFQDIDEAAQCLRKAADQGYAKAQLGYGMICEAGQGVPQDFVEAMRWYRKAAEQKEPHVNCHIGTLYFNGQGVPQDRDKAASLFRPEAESGCSSSQFGLGRICEMENDMDEALRWYRLAAGEGGTTAQAKLGDLLSDGLSTKPDYVEACQWLSLAATAGDKVSEVRLRRVKTKLTAEQLDEVAKRVTTITQRLEEKEKEREKKAIKQKSPDRTLGVF